MTNLPLLAVRAVFFARYAELLGTRRADLAVPAGARISDAILAVRALPGGAALPARLLVARNHEQAADDTPVADGDELAFLPPMSGG
jgi:molybdopterin converting factor subunit 1